MIDEIIAAVEAVEDPEVPVTLHDLGVLRAVEISDGTVRVVLRPTRLGCPARERMASDVVAAVRRVAGHLPVDIDWELVPWSDDQVSPAGREALAEIGYALLLGNAPTCPYCGSDDARRDGTFGGAVCKTPFTCRACGSTFDALRSSAKT